MMNPRRVTEVAVFSNGQWDKARTDGLQKAVDRQSGPLMKQLTDQPDIYAQRCLSFAEPHIGRLAMFVTLANGDVIKTEVTRKAGMSKPLTEADETGPFEPDPDDVDELEAALQALVDRFGERTVANTLDLMSAF